MTPQAAPIDRPKTDSTLHKQTTGTEHVQTTMITVGTDYSLQVYCRGRTSDPRPHTVLHTHTPYVHHVDATVDLNQLSFSYIRKSE
jgi:hypothetical protein